VAVDGAGLERLVLRARRRDPQALDELVRRYSSRVFGLLYRLCGSRERAEDLMQETFLRMVRMIGEYEHQGKFDAWLFRIAANLARDGARRQRRRGAPASLDAGDENGAVLRDRAAADPAAVMRAGEEQRLLAAALEHLNETDREILLLRHYSELPFREIAEILEIPLGTALARAHRALRRLRDELGAEADGDA
jgi:RNA polymerase sigma-70 factor (ECF subfamily)